MPQRGGITRKHMLVLIFRDPLYILITIIGTLINYFVFKYAILYSNRGLFFVSAPLYLIYPLLITGGILLAMAAYSIKINAITALDKASESALGVLLPGIGSIISSCVCSYPLFATALLLLGVNTVAVSGIVSFVNAYQQPIILLVIAINMVTIYHYLGVVATGCGIANKRKKG